MEPPHRTSQWISRIRALGWKKVAKNIVGIVLILVGLFALLTPLSPGSWLILVGLEFLGLRILLQDKLLAWVHARPGSKLARVVCRLMCVWERDPARKRMWHRLWRGRGRRSSSRRSANPDDSHG